MVRTKSYSEMIGFDTFVERFLYLRISGRVGEETFGSDRHLNQGFYKSYEWRNVRDFVIARDLGCDLAMEGFEILDGLLVHHIDPISLADVRQGTEKLLDPDNLVTTTHQTHNSIHFGTALLVAMEPVVRRPRDTSPW